MRTVEIRNGSNQLDHLLVSDSLGTKKERLWQTNHLVSTTLWMDQTSTGWSAARASCDSTGLNESSTSSISTGSAQDTILHWRLTASWHCWGTLARRSCCWILKMETTFAKSRANRRCSLKSARIACARTP